MDPNTFTHAVFLYLMNVIFMIAGIFLNSVVIISLRRSSQLRKKLCYFMILPLSCFDLAVVAIGHPILIYYTILFSMDTHSQAEKKWIWMQVILSNLAVFSMSALLTLGVERFLALKYPFFHQTAITRKRLTLFLTFLVVITVTLSSLKSLDETIFGSLLMVFILIFLFVFIYLNYTTYIIAKSKSKQKSIVSMHGHQDIKAQKLNLKQIFTCLIALG